MTNLEINIRPVILRWICHTIEKGRKLFTKRTVITSRRLDKWRKITNTTFRTSNVQTTFYNSHIPIQRPHSSHSPPIDSLYYYHCLINRRCHHTCQQIPLRHRRRAVRYSPRLDWRNILTFHCWKSSCPKMIIYVTCRWRNGARMHPLQRCSNN